MEWLIIVLVLVGIFVFMKLSNKGQNVWSYIVVALFIFVIISFIYVAAVKPGIDLGSSEGISNLGKTYFQWLGQIGSNLARLTGNVVNLDWGPVNSTK